jgi:hypothetical protein
MHQGRSEGRGIGTREGYETCVNFFLSENLEERSHFGGLGVDGDRLCGLVVRDSGCRSRGPGFDSRRFQIF